MSTRNEISEADVLFGNDHDPGPDPPKPDEPIEQEDKGQDTQSPDPVDEARHWLRLAYEDGRGQEADDGLRRESARLRKEHFARSEWKRPKWTKMEPNPWEKAKRVSPLFWETYGHMMDHSLSRSEAIRLTVERKIPQHIKRTPRGDEVSFIQVLTVPEPEEMAPLYNCIFRPIPAIDYAPFRPPVTPDSGRPLRPISATCYGVSGHPPCEHE